MGPTPPLDARWIRSAPRHDLPAATLNRVVHSAFPHSRALEIELLVDGLRNANFKVHIDSMPDAIVLRIYEQDPSICLKELDLFGLLRGLVPIPEVVHAEPLGLEDIPPFVIFRYINGISFRELVRSGDAVAIAQAAHAVGETLAAIGSVTFPRAGWLEPGPTVRSLLEGADPMPRFVNSCLASPKLQRCMPAELIDATRAAIWSRASQLSTLGSESCLVHGDFGKRNLLVSERASRWSVAAVLDWEFAVSGSPLADVAHFLRYERISRPRAEPHFSSGYLQAGGNLPKDWRYLGRLVDLSALCEALTHDELPEDVTGELLELVRATVDRRDPQV